MSTANTAITESTAPGVPGNTTAFVYARLLPTLVVFLLALAILGRRVDRDDYTKHFSNWLWRDGTRRKSVQAAPSVSRVPDSVLGRLKSGHAGCALRRSLSPPRWLLAPAWMTADLLGRRRTVSTARDRPTACPLLTLAMPLPNWWRGYLMVAQPSANIWHNPTAPFAMPFCLALFLGGMRLLAQLDYRTAALTGVLMVLSLLAKPNYVLAFAPVFGPTLLAMLWRAWQEGRPASILVGIALLTFGPAIAVASVQAVVLHERSIIFVKFLEVWQRHSHSGSMSAVSYWVRLNSWRGGRPLLSSAR